MSGNKGNAEATALQRESLDEQRRVNNSQLEFLARQTAALEKTKLPDYKAPSPPPMPGTNGNDFAASQAKLAASRRFGYKDTVLGGARLNNMAAA